MVILVCKLCGTSRTAVKPSRSIISLNKSDPKEKRLNLNIIRSWILTLYYFSRGPKISRVWSNCFESTLL